MNQTPTHEELIQRIQSLENECAELRRRLFHMSDSDNKFRAFFDNSLDGLLITKPDGAVLEANPAVCKMFGYSPEEMLRLGREAIVDLDDPRLAPALQQRAENRYFSGELNFKRKDGTIVPVEITSVVFNTKAGDEQASIIVRDISERKLAQELHDQQEQLNQQLLDSIPCIAILLRPETREIVAMNKAAKEAGCEYSHTCYETWPKFKDPCPWCLAPAVWADGKAHHLEFEGLSAAWEAHWVPVSDDLYLHYAFDVTDRKVAQKEIEKQRYLLQSMEKISRVGGWEYELSTQKVSWTDGTYAIHDVAKGAFNPDDPNRNIQLYHPEDQKIISEAFRRAVEKGESYDLELRLRPENRAVQWVRTIGRPEMHEGRVVRVLGNIIDITARIKAEEEREGIQGQLLQAQKLESVGRLAGGVAHDYNNMLSVIAGYTELALERVAPDSELHADLKEIQAAAKRSIDITRQLLAFARKQTIDPQVVDLNELVESILRMLRRLIGEEVELVWYPGKHLWAVEMDPAQVDQILANLCVNARDAIDGVGKVTIETGNAVCDDAWCNANAGSRPGEFVVLTVSDDGSGMDKETLGRIFEPFFTTKGVTEGTGLGLATIYGIVQQNKGFINVHSAPGQGTTFKIHLPRHAADPAAAEMETEVQPSVGHGESVLVVEDEPAIMKMTQALLQRLGYRVFAVGSPSQALQLAKTHTDDIDLLVTDVVMPEMNGRDLAHQMNSLYPNMKTLYMSGYTADVIAHRGVLEKGLNFIQKPFSIKDLSVQVRATLDQK